MDTIITKEELVECLFKELDESVPQQDVHPSFLLRVGGICHGLIYAGSCEDPPYLADTFATLGPDSGPTCCGTKMVALAHALENEGCFDPGRAWTIDWLIQLMLEVLHSQELVVRPDRHKGQRIVTSTRNYEERRKMRIHVKLEKSQGA